jgi:hypothetical protein
MSLLALAGTNSATGGYDIANSLKLEIDNSEYLGKTFGSSGNRKAWTWSSWVKRTELNSSTTYQLLFSAGTGNPPRDVFFFDDDTDDTLCFFSNGGLFSSATLGFRTNAVFRDTSAWYHIVLVLDTANSTAADRLKLYVNGVSQTFSTYNAPTQNADSLINSNTDHAIGRDSSFAALGFNAQYFSGYMAETHFVDGSALAPTEFGEFDDDSGIWKPKAYTGSYGSNGFYLDFADAADLGDDESGNGNDWTEGNLSAADQATDTPTNNFCTINPLINYYGSVSEGATKWLHTASGDGWESFVATMGAGTSGKWYAEFKFVDSDNDNMIGICPIDDPDLNRGADHFAYYGSDTSLDESVGYYASSGVRFIGGGPASYGNSYNRTNIMSVAVDMDNGKLYFAKDGVWQNSGDPTSGATGTGALDVRGATKPQSLGASNYYSGEDILANYGGFTTMPISTPETDANGYGTFEYAPPSGYYALCTKNLEEFG